MLPRSPQDSGWQRNHEKSLLALDAYIVLTPK